MSKWLTDYDYQYPEALVAQEPLPDRAASRMMVLSRTEQSIGHDHFHSLAKYLNSGDLVVSNNTSVLASRLFARKKTGGKVEVLLIRRTQDLQWQAWISPLRGLQAGDTLALFSRSTEKLAPVSIQLHSLEPQNCRVGFFSQADEQAALTQYGEMPLPPYISRTSPQLQDRARYQTVFADRPGAVAAPTAGLHFTKGMQEALAAKGVAWATVTLHVGPGTFAPVKVEDIDEHPMHAEWYEVPEATQTALRACRARGGRVLAVGTTTLRALESFSLSGQPQAWTDLFIRPGFALQVVDHLLTNFHQPKSTLLILVATLLGREFLFQAYEEAIRAEYRLFSYGDCMLIQR